MTEPSTSKTAPDREGSATSPAGDERRERSAAALRANLKRRKAQSRDRQSQADVAASKPTKVEL